MSSTGLVPILVCACVIGGGCNRSSSSDERAPAGTPQPGGAATIATRSEKSRSACELITDEEASAIVGSPLVAKERSDGPASSSCFFAPTDGHTHEFLLRVTWTGGREAWEVHERATALSGRLMGGDRNAATSAVMKFEGAPLGDRSSYNPILGAYVLQGDVLLEFNNLLTLRDPRSTWEKLAQKALERLDAAPVHQSQGR